MQIEIGTEQQDGAIMVNVPLGRGGKYGRMDVNLANFDNTVNQHVYIYGLRQILNDSIADKEGLNDEEIVAKAQKRLDTLYSGELRTRRESGEPADPIEAEILRLARSAVIDFYRTTPEWKECKGKDRAEKCAALRHELRKAKAETLDNAIEMYVAAKREELEKAAKRNVADRERNATDAAEVVEI